MFGISKKKFLNKTFEWKHKKSAMLLRLIYEGDKEDLLSQYNLYQEWMGESGLESIIDKRVLSDKYHEHLVKAKVCLKEHNFLPKIDKGDKEFRRKDFLPVTVYLDNLRSAHNVGSILRTAEAFGLGEVIFSDKTPFVDHSLVKKTSMGSYQWIACEKKKLQDLPSPVVILETAEEAIPFTDFIFPSLFTLVVGNEEYGCSETTLRKADYLVKIPLYGRKNSLNVANAFAIVASEILRQQSKREGGES